MTTARRTRYVLWVSVAAVVLGIAVAVALFASSGHRAFTVTTPSMGTTYPVGSLVVTDPQSEYRAGDPVTFTVNNRIYTHRITDVNGDEFTTRGDLNDADDAWTITEAEIIGKVVWSARGLGWLVQALPVLLLTFVVSEIVVRAFRMVGRWRWVARIVSWSAAVAAINLWLRPFFDMVLLNWYANDANTVTMKVVGTGAFAMDANGVQVSPGEAVSVRVTDPNQNGVFTLVPTPDLSVLQWALIMLICLLPLATALTLHFSRRVPATAKKSTAPGLVGSKPLIQGSLVQKMKAISPATLVTAIAATVLVVLCFLIPSTQAALTAQVTNSTDTAGTRPFFTCKNAMIRLSDNNPPLFGYLMNSVPSSRREPTVLPFTPAGSGNNDLVYLNYVPPGQQRQHQHQHPVVSGTLHKPR